MANDKLAKPLPMWAKLKMNGNTLFRNLSIYGGWFRVCKDNKLQQLLQPDTAHLQQFPSETSYLSCTISHKHAEVPGFDS